MQGFIELLRKKWLCWRDGKDGCENCKHCANDFDFVGFQMHLPYKESRKH